MSGDDNRNIFNIYKRSMNYILKYFMIDDNFSKLLDFQIIKKSGKNINETI